MLSIASVNDNSTNLLSSIGVLPEFNIAKSSYKTINDEYNKQIKNITG